MWTLPLVFAITALGFSMIEERLPLSRSDRTVFLHVVLSNALPTALLEAACFALLAVIAGSAGRHGWMAAQPTWLQLVVLVALTELSFYWVHRAMHRWPRLWRFHRLHHTPTEMTWIAGYRKHVVETALHYLVPFLPIALLGFSAESWAIFGILSVVFTGFTHLDVSWRMRWLGWLVVTPEYHARHHGRSELDQNGNFAGKLSALDWVFRTRRARSGYPKSYGTDGETPDSWWKQQTRGVLFPPHPSVPSSRWGGEGSLGTNRSGYSTGEELAHESSV